MSTHVYGWIVTLYDDIHACPVEIEEVLADTSELGVVIEHEAEDKYLLHLNRPWSSYVPLDGLTKEEAFELAHEAVDEWRRLVRRLIESGRGVPVLSQTREDAIEMEVHQRGTAALNKVRDRFMLVSDKPQLHLVMDPEAFNGASTGYFGQTQGKAFNCGDPGCPQCTPKP